VTGRRKTGEKPKTNLPLKIDRLPQGMRDRIVFEHNTLGRPWNGLWSGPVKV
jgi:hypothetical protein